MELNPLINLTAELYLKVADNATGDVTALLVKLTGVNPEKLENLNEEYIDKKRKETSEMFGVPKKAVKLISKEEYDKIIKEADMDFDLDEDPDAIWEL